MFWVTLESSEEAEGTFWDVDPERVRTIQRTANASLCVLLVVAKQPFESQSMPPISGSCRRLSAVHSLRWIFVHHGKRIAIFIPN
jgi:hypothetical protein